MKIQAACAWAVGLSVCVASLGYGQQVPPAPPALQEKVAPDIPGIVAGGTKVEILGTTFKGTDGAIALPDGSLLFAEANAKRLAKIDDNKTVSTFLDVADAANPMGLAFDSKGRLLSFRRPQGAGPQIAVLYPKGSEAVLLAEVDGKPLAAPNDLIVTRNGGIYITDPGRASVSAPPNPAIPPALYFVSPSGKATRVIAEGLNYPNGIQLSLDEKTLYVNESNGDYVLAYEIAPDGTLRNRRNFAKYQGPWEGAQGGHYDGLVVDSQDRVYVASPAGIQVFTPKGVQLGTIPMPGDAQSLAFAGPNRKTLYAIGRGGVFRVQMIAQGPAGRVK